MKFQHNIINDNTTVDCLFALARSERTEFRTSLPRQQGSKLQGNASVVTHCLIMGQGDRGGGEGGAASFSWLVNVAP